MTWKGVPVSKRSTPLTAYVFEFPLTLLLNSQL
jgi:hypothetical protein